MVESEKVIQRTTQRVICFPTKQIQSLFNHKIDSIGRARASVTMEKWFLAGSFYRENVTPNDGSLNNRTWKVKFLVF